MTIESIAAPKLMGALAGIGAAIGLGQLLTSDAPLSLRWVLGRALVSGGLGASASAVVLIFPDLTFAAQCGLAAGMASIGASGVDRLFSSLLRLKPAATPQEPEPDEAH